MSSAPEADASGLLLRCRCADGTSTYLFSHRAGEKERRAAAASLRSSNYAIVDNLLGAASALQLREQALNIYRHHLRTSRLAPSEAVRMAMATM